MKAANSLDHSFSAADDGMAWSELIEGNKEGLEKLYNTYSPVLFRYGMAIKAESSLVKDCIQELFVDLWKYRTKLRKDSDVKLYLFKALSNRVFKELSIEKKNQQKQEKLCYDLVFLEESAEDMLITNQRNESLQKKLQLALEKLPPRQKELIQLLFFENQSYEFSSKILGITIDSCYTLAWKAIANLKKGILVFCCFIG